jgi:hypothetical protein
MKKKTKTKKTVFGILHVSIYIKDALLLIVALPVVE